MVSESNPYIISKVNSKGETLWYYLDVDDRERGGYRQESVAVQELDYYKQDRIAFHADTLDLDNYYDEDEDDDY